MPAEGKSWTYIDEVERRALLLDDSDMCYYYLVRTSGGFSTSEANNRIDNFKKKPEQGGDRRTGRGLGGRVHGRGAEPRHS